MKSSDEILLAAAVFLTVALACVVVGLRRSLVGRRHTLLTFAWLCAAVTVTLVIFSSFPESTASGTVLGFSLTGAAAFVVAILLIAVRVQRQMAALDNPELTTQMKTEEVARLTDELAKLRQRADPRPIEQSIVYLCRPAVRGVRLGVVTGNLQLVRCADIWVNSENVDMQMSRFHERSISGLIRYLGAQRDDSGRVELDLISDELAEKVHGRAPVTPGATFVTGPGSLAKSNDVRAVVHVASVQGEPGIGYRQVRGIDQCVVNALTAADNVQGAKSVIIPLFGVGEAGADPGVTASVLVRTTVDRLRSLQMSSLREVYLLAYTDLELSALQAAFATVDLTLQRHE